MENDGLLYKLALLFVPGIGPVMGRRLVSYIGGVKDIFTQKPLSLVKVPGVGEQLARNIVRGEALQRAEKELRFIQDNDIRTIFYLDDDYPALMRELDDAPLMLFVKGEFDFAGQDRYIGIVGTRRPSQYGKNACAMLIQDLASQKFNPVIISGLAYGIDAQAHQAALDNGLKTIAVLGHGLDMIYPASHRALARKIIKSGGALITEYPSNTRVEKSMFVRRNRVIAALGQATVIVESSLNGGALITARYAASYDRVVVAFPGRATDETFSGCNWLIKTGKAHMIENAKDLTDLLGWLPPQGQQKIEFEPPPLTSEEQKVVDLLRDVDKMHVDEIALRTGITIGQLLVVMFNLEMKKLVDQLPGNFYALRKL